VKRALLIFGMHRSGTSAAARVVNLLGAELGNELVPPGPDNPDGFWEHAEAVRINDDLLQGLGRTWYEMRGMPDGWVDSPHADAAARRIGGLIERDFATTDLCAIKDPRMCLVAPLWIEAFEAKGFEVACLFVVRDPREVVESMHRRNNWPRAPLYLMWVQYLMEATAASARRSRAMITYDGLLSDWRGSVAHVARELGVHWPSTPDGAVAKAVDAFLDPGRRHHKAPHEAVGEAAAMPELAATFYRACLGIASGEKKWAVISGRHDSYREIDRMYAAHVDHLLAERWSAEHRMQTAEARLAEQASVTTTVRETVQALQENLDARLGSVERNLVQQAHAMQADAAARWEAQARMAERIQASLRQLQDEMSAFSGETAARFKRQRESVMAVEARVQRQHALLNTIALRLEQAAGERASESPAILRVPSPPETQELLSALADSNGRIAALLASTSWKMTAPMRWFSMHVLRRPPALVGPVPPASMASDSRGDRLREPPGVPHGMPGGDAPVAKADARKTRSGRSRNTAVAFRWI